jgi:imidazolonepropionase-like amidohydrolase
MRMDLAGRTLMPGLIDCQVHVVVSVADIAANAMPPDAVVDSCAGKLMHEMFMRGSTRLRDLGGATVGLRMAWEEGLFTGSRLSLCDKALSKTSGDCALRTRADTRAFEFFAARLGSLGRLVDGVDEVRRACREEIKGGAGYIKLLAHGGVASPYDPIAFFGFSQSALRAAVEEAAMARTYVAEHLYTGAVIARALRCGVLSLEDCNLTTVGTAREAAGAGSITCPNLVTYQALKEERASLGLEPESVARIDDMRLASLGSLERAQRAGLMMAFGTDLLGPMHGRQSEEFLIRREVLPPAEILSNATSHAAKLRPQEGRLGVVAPGALADRIAVEGDPLADLALLTEQGARLSNIIQGGRFVKNPLP